MSSPVDPIDLLQTGGFVERPDRALLEVRGPDRVRFLNGMLSRDIPKIPTGGGAIAIKANQKGRVEGVVRVRVDRERVFLDLARSSADRVAEHLRRFIVMDDCEIEDRTHAYRCFGAWGPEAPNFAATLGVDLRQMPPDGFALVGGTMLVHDPHLGVPGIEIWAPTGEAALYAPSLRECFQAASMADYHRARVEAGQPLDGVDIDEDTIPLEARLDAAIDNQKGCYIGQEVIARATNLGGVKHHLVGLVSDAPEPPEPAPLMVPPGDKPVGELTSAVWSHALGKTIGLGYLPTKHEAIGTKVETERGVHLTVAALPFRSPETPDPA